MSHGMGRKNVGSAFEDICAVAFSTSSMLFDIQRIGTAVYGIRRIRIGRSTEASMGGATLELGHNRFLVVMVLRQERRAVIGRPLRPRAQW